ncbi:hypothetical protein B484DRAFT_482567 [Ochromonadaceae sp. CCMP2298]|nr:hypothetical protein B484DRAFT_482567 [Ochromonadaceae sp. CCMP2298]
MSDTNVVRYNFQGAQELSSVKCEHLIAHGPQIANHLGYGPCGISKGSRAAQAMSMEARAQGGGVLKMSNGGITAALQSIGDAGYIKPAALEALHSGMVRGGIKRGIGR